MKKEKIISYLKKLFKFVLCFACFYYSGYLQYIPVLLLHIKKITPHIQILLSLFSNIGAAILIALIYWKDLKKEFHIFKKNWRSCLDTGFGYWTVGLVIMMVSNIIINLFSSQHIAGNEQAVRAMIDALPLFMFINAGLIAPFVEEVVFRKGFRTLIENKWAFALVTGLVFGGMHVIGNVHTFVDVFYIIPYGALGFCFGLAYYDTDTVFTTIALHMFHNMILTIISIF